MTKNLVLIKFLLIVFGFFVFQITAAQDGEKQTIPLTNLLDKISNKHKVFFTYDANLLSNKLVQEDGFVDLSLKESISLLEKLH
jgi:iron complex outermembrane receptor protein